jgi:hypothetical protein
MENRAGESVPSNPGERDVHRIGGTPDAPNTAA